MGQSERFENEQSEKQETKIVDAYTSESSEDIYNTPDVSGSLRTDDPIGQTPGKDKEVEICLGEVVQIDQAAKEDNAVPNEQDGNSYGNPSYAVNPYGNGPYGGNNPYGNGSNHGSNPYGNSPYGGGSPYGNDPYRGSNPYGNGPSYDKNPYGNGSYGGNNPYGSGNPYGGQGNNPYSPYAAPAKKNNMGLIIGIVVAVIVLFLIAVGALTYKAVSLYSEEKNRRRSARDEYNFDDDDWKKDRNRDLYDDQDDYDDYGFDDYDDYGDYDFDDYDDYDYDSEEYYTLHDDLRTDLSYSVEFEYYEYESDYDNVEILVSYPVIESDHVPNLEQLNSEIQGEIDLLTGYFEEEYQQYLTEDDYFSALSTSYVTYMDEEKMSIVFSESAYSNYYDDVFLYCINIDMENGVILNNENMLSIDDDFSIEFRTKSDIQNGEISYLNMMSDQEITDYFNSPNLIVFYTPKGMEIGFNYDIGWVTVTYEDYEQYLKVF